MAAQPPGREYVLSFAAMACRVMGNRRNTNATIRRRSTDTLLQRDAGRTARDDPPPRQERRWALHEWLDSRSGIGVLERGTAGQGYDLQLTRYAKEGRRAIFYVASRSPSTPRTH